MRSYGFARLRAATARNLSGGETRNNLCERDVVSGVVFYTRMGRHIPLWSEAIRAICDARARDTKLGIRRACSCRCSLSGIRGLILGTWWILSTPLQYPISSSAFLTRASRIMLLQCSRIREVIFEYVRGRRWTPGVYFHDGNYSSVIAHSSESVRI